MDSRQILSQVNKFTDTNILIVGDVMLDLYVRGEVERISPEAPVPVILEKEREYVLGGAANVAHNITSLGGRATLIGVVGDDAEADILREKCKEAKITPHLVRDRYRPTTLKMRPVAKGHQLLRMDRESHESLSADTENKIISTIEQLSDVGVVVVSDYAKGFFTQKIIDALDKKYGKDRIFADVKPKNAHLARGIRLIKPNIKEVYDMVDVYIEDDADAERAAQRLVEIFNSSFLITRGERGMTLVYDSVIEHISSHEVQVYDVTGAGDTVMAVLVLALANNIPLLNAAHFANYIASRVVEKEGTATITQEEIENILTNQ